MFMKMFLGVLIICSLVASASADTYFIEYTLDDDWIYKQEYVGTLSLSDNPSGGITATINVPSGIDDGGLTASRHDLAGFSMGNYGFIELDYSSLTSTISGTTAYLGLCLEVEFYDSESNRYQIAMAIGQSSGSLNFETWLAKDSGFDYYDEVPIPDGLATNEGVLGLYWHDTYVSAYFKDVGGNVLYPFLDWDMSQIVGTHDFSVDNDFEADTLDGGTVIASVNLEQVVYGHGSPLSDEPNGELVTSDLWIGAVINTEEKGPIEAVWKKGGEDTTSRGDRVIWGHFYASPSDVTWGSENNPDLFVKIWFDVSGRVDVNYFHVSVPDIEVYSDYPYDGTPDEQGTTTMSRRYIRQYYESGQSYSEENYEDGSAPSGYSPVGNPSGYSTINDLRIGSMINTVEKGPVDAVWRFGGQDTTSRGDQVVWGHFYANPSDVTWGSENNPDLFVKIWFDVSGRVDANFFHVSVPDIEVYSDLPDDGTYDQKGTTIMDNRYIRHEYWR